MYHLILSSLDLTEVFLATQSLSKSVGLYSVLLQSSNPFLTSL